MLPGPRISARAAGFAAAASVALALAVGALGSLATASNVSTWYASLEKPAFNPPNAVFGPVWTVLYVVMALAAWRVWRTATPEPARRRAPGSALRPRSTPRSGG